MTKASGCGRSGAAGRGQESASGPSNWFRAAAGRPQVTRTTNELACQLDRTMATPPAVW